MTDEQIIAAAGASYLSDAERRSFDGYDGPIAVGDPAGQRPAIRPTRRAAVKPLRERIADLEAEVERFGAEQIVMNIAESKLRQQNAELTKQRDVLFDALDEATDVIVAYYGTDARLSKKCLAAISAHKAGGAA